MVISNSSKPEGREGAGMVEADGIGTGGGTGLARCLKPDVDVWLLLGFLIFSSSRSPNTSPESSTACRTSALFKKPILQIILTHDCVVISERVRGRDGLLGAAMVVRLTVLLHLLLLLHMLPRDHRDRFRRWFLVRVP